PGDDPYPMDENGKVIYHNTDIRDTWKVMEDCKAAGLTKSIGVSSFNRRQLELILNMPDLRYKPVCNQVTDTSNVYSPTACDTTKTRSKLVIQVLPVLLSHASQSSQGMLILGQSKSEVVRRVRYKGWGKTDKGLQILQKGERYIKFSHNLHRGFAQI
ncbi:hypothetical protein AB205_0025520, partial [Aquarana catesbeiana]